MIYTILQLGLIYSLLALGVYITYSLLNFPDLSVDGTICLGGTVTAGLIIGGVNPYLATALAVIAGSLAGLCTGVLHVKGKINGLICGIITTTALYSINLVVMGGRPNVSLTSKETIFSWLLNLLPRKYAFIAVALIICIIVKFALNFIMDSRFGLYLRCVGSNEKLVSTFGGDVGGFKIIGLMLSNALVAFCGAVIVQQQGYCDVGMSIGALILGLTMVILGIKIQRLLKIWQTSICVMMASVLYQAVIGIALIMGLPTIFLKLTTAVLLVVILVLRKETV